jgi:hypothetical protein
MKGNELFSYYTDKSPLYVGSEHRDVRFEVFTAVTIHRDVSEVGDLPYRSLWPVSNQGYSHFPLPT